MLGLDALTGALSNTKANKTSTYSGTQNYGSTQTYGRTLTPFQSQLQSPLFSTITNLMQNPQAYLQPFQTQARNQVNANYSGLADTLRQKFLSTGGGSSGKYGLALAGGETARLGDLSNVDTNFAQQAASLPITAGVPAATSLLGMNFGGTSSTSGSDTSSGKNVGPGSPLAGGFQGFTAGANSLQNQLLSMILSGAV